MTLEKFFGVKVAGSTPRTELLAGVTTFVTMAYILAVNPAILSQAGMDSGAVFTATVVATVIATLIMGLWAKLPFALAPGMGLNAFFALVVCLAMKHTWQFALTAVFIEGIIFILLTLFNVREAIVNAIPAGLKHAIGVGIGLFIAFVGLQNAGIIVKDEATLVKLGEITSGGALLALAGLLITAVMLARRVKGALLLGMLITTVIGLPLGITRYAGVVSLPPSMAPTFLQFDFSEILSVEMVVVVFTFLFVDIFDTLGTLVGVSVKAGIATPSGEPPRLKQAFMADAVGTTVGAALGTSTLAAYVESAAGVAEGGRTGLTAVVTAGCFALALFFSPLFLAIPTAATAPVLVLVGVFMMTPVKDIDLGDYTEAIPAFLCIVTMPLAYSVAEGIALGMLAYVLINLLGGKRKKLSVAMYVLAAVFIIKYLIG
ncbi:MAG: NCS2 family permease [Odoribacteraceae bacterium]|jgi:AGZA family xanthine/uracil permease-like MFS transporter|nr:NCS2 family permease [Odoribacteraceae bacterium]